MSVLAVSTPGLMSGRNALLIIICETLQSRFPNTMNPTPGVYDTQEELLYKIAVTVGNIPATGGAANYGGSGSPEGAQAASPDSTYWDRTNKAFYVKDTGTGSTGWQILVS